MVIFSPLFPKRIEAYGSIPRCFGSIVTIGNRARVRMFEALPLFRSTEKAEKHGPPRRLFLDLTHHQPEETVRGSVRASATERMNPNHIQDSPSEMLNFKVVSALSRQGPRLGRLTKAGRNAVQTPNYVANTSRGVVPHISPDVLSDHTRIPGVYMALEDCKLCLWSAASG
jgi:hypothetical protein